MKHDLAKLMKQNLSNINKIKKESFLPPVVPVIFLGVEIVSAGMNAAAAAAEGGVSGFMSQQLVASNPKVML